MQIELTEERINALKKLAKRKCHVDEEHFSAWDTFGSNVDDAFDGGVTDGESLLARDILDEMGISFD